MNLRWKTIGFATISLLLLIVVSDRVLSSVLLERYRELESRFVSDDSSRAHDALLARANYLEAKAIDWGYWDDTYQFIVQKDSAYIDSNLTDESIVFLGIEQVVYFDIALNVVYRKAVDLESGKETPFPELVQQRLLKSGLLEKGGSEIKKGVLLTEEYPFLFVAVPIRTSERLGIPRGYVVFIVPIRDALVAEIAQVTHTVVNIVQLSELGKKSIDFSALDSEHEDYYSRIISDNEISAYRLIRQADGTPAFVVEVVIPRLVFAQGVSTLRTLRINLIILSLIGGLLALLFLERFVLSRIALLDKDVNAIACGGDISKRVAISGSDELSRLEENINAMLHGLELAQLEIVRAKEKAEAASRAKSEFLANMSHEIRTPMNGVLGMASLLGDTELTEGQRDYLRTIISSAESLLRVINDILDLSRIEARRVELVRDTFNFKEMLDDIHSLFHPAAQAKQLVLRSNLDAEIPASLSGDRGRIRQVLINLVGNSIKFTKQGEVEIRIVLRGRVGESAWIQIVVRDTGIGIPGDKLSHVFEQFNQVDNSVSRNFGGTGLGLTISSELVKLMGGDIKVESQVGVGSVFTVDLTLPVVQAEGKKLELSSSRTSPVFTKEHRVLLAEDNIVNRNLAVKMLEKLGVAVDIAENGERAVDQMRQHHYDLVFMDCSMPVLDGFLATQQIRRELSKKVPIIAFTASAMEGDRERCLAAGMSDFLAKPFRREDFEAIISRWLSK